MAESSVTCVVSCLRSVYDTATEEGVRLGVIDIGNFTESLPLPGAGGGDSCAVNEVLCLYGVRFCFGTGFFVILFGGLCFCLSTGSFFFIVRLLPRGDG